MAINCSTSSSPVPHQENGALSPDTTSTLNEISLRRGLSVTFLRNEIMRGNLRAIILAPDSHRKKVRVFFRDEIAWLESNIIQSGS